MIGNLFGSSLDSVPNNYDSINNTIQSKRRRDLYARSSGSDFTSKISISWCNFRLLTEI